MKRCAKVALLSLALLSLAACGGSQRSTGGFEAGHTYRPEPSVWVGVPKHAFQNVDAVGMTHYGWSVSVVNESDELKEIVCWFTLLDKSDIPLDTSAGTSMVSARASGLVAYEGYGDFNWSRVGRSIAECKAY